MRTQVGIVGAGPAGLLLAHFLAHRGIETVILERQSREHVERRVRAGVLEQGTVDLLTESGVADRLHREGLPHDGIELRFEGRGHRLDLAELTGGKRITVYGQQEVVKDLIARRLDDGGDVRFEAEATELRGLDGDEPVVAFFEDGEEVELRCDVIAGCDGFHGIARRSLPRDRVTVRERTYPFAWLGVLAEVAPSSEELIYCRHENGFALHSMRSPSLTRLYLQVEPDSDPADWSDDRIWSELQTRLRTEDGWELESGPVLERILAPMRSFVVEPMRYGQLFLAGDAAHIVPPTGAKGMNLAIADVRRLARALGDWYERHDETGLDAYSGACLARVWRAQHFSWFMTSMLHVAPDQDPFEAGLQISQLRYVTSSRAAATTLAENYVGLPYE
jgi:p-hydroxybenzoate 3-monooxygenase